MEFEFSEILPTRKLITDPSQYLNDAWLLKGNDFFMGYFVQKAMLRVGGLCSSVVVYLASIPEILCSTLSTEKKMQQNTTGLFLSGHTYMLLQLWCQANVF